MPRPSRPIELRESDRCQGTQPPPEAPGWPPWEGRVDSLGGRSTRLARSSTTRSQSMTTSPRPDLQALLPHGDGPGAITPDGCSVELYSALPPAQEPRIVHDASPHGASILELGAGAGRVTHALLALGHPVVAVDESPEMLERIHGAETVLARIEELALSRRFDAVLPEGELVYRMRDVTRPEPGLVSATMEYQIGERTWNQSFTSQRVDDAQLAEDLAAVGLAVDA